MTTGTEGTYIAEFWLEFVHPETLVISTRSRRLEKYNVLFHYYFFDEDQIRIQARDIDEWEIAQDGKRLVIHSAYGLVPSGDYDRIVSVPWAVVALLLGILAVAMLVALLRSSKHYRSIGNPSYSGRASRLQGGRDGRFDYILAEVLMFVFFAGGLGISLIFWGGWDLFLIRLPWDAVIILEVGLLLFALGTFTLVKHRTTSETRLWSPQKKWRYAGVAVIGCSIPGMAIGVFKLALILLIGSYGYGA